jgi:tetratricopeptide (TPR) repeat protein
MALTFNEYLTKNVLDSIMIFADIALSFNDQCSEAYNLKGFYYSEMGKSEKAIEEYDKAIKLNPNNWGAYWGKGNLYYANDLVNNINCLQKASSLYRGQGLPKLLSDIGWAYTCAGFSEKAKYYYKERLRLDDDSSTYYYHLGLNEWCFLNFNKCIEFEERAYAIDSTNISLVGNLATQYANSGRYKESIKYFKKYLDKAKIQGLFAYNLMREIGYAYWQNGQKDSAEYYFSEQIKYCNRQNELKRSWGEKFYTYYDLAGVYAFLGEKGKAYENLRIFSQIQRVPSWMPAVIKNDPLFGSIRNEPEFQQIVMDMEAKYQAEHERVRKWMEEKGEL